MLSKEEVVPYAIYTFLIFQEILIEIMLPEGCDLYSPKFYKKKNYVENCQLLCCFCPKLYLTVAGISRLSSKCNTFKHQRLLKSKINMVYIEGIRMHRYFYGGVNTFCVLFNTNFHSQLLFVCKVKIGLRCVSLAELTKFFCQKQN